MGLFRELEKHTYERHFKKDISTRIPLHRGDGGGNPQNQPKEL